MPRVSVGGGETPGGGAEAPEPVVVARERGDVTLRCAVKGRPPPRALWLKDGDPLSPNNHDIVIVDGSVSTLHYLLIYAVLYQVYSAV